MSLDEVSVLVSDLDLFLEMEVVTVLSEDMKDMAPPASTVMSCCMVMSAIVFDAANTDRNVKQLIKGRVFTLGALLRENVTLLLNIE